MIDEREVLIRALDALSISIVRGPDQTGRVSLELTGAGFIDLGQAGALAADCALEWRSRHLVRWLGQALRVAEMT